MRLHAEYINGSGGHDHLTTKRPENTERERRLNYGSFFSYSSSDNFNPNFMKGKIFERNESDTVSRFEYIASIWGDKMKICVESLENKLLNKDSVTIIERIPGLVPLVPGENYKLIGGTKEHCGPSDKYILSDSCKQLNHNHYGTKYLVKKILQIVSDYNNFFPEKILEINDMSLPFGGKFDINGSWGGSHMNHRTGLNVDIRSKKMIGDLYKDINNNGTYDNGEILIRDSNNNGIYDGIGTLETFSKICKKRKAKYILLENPGAGFEHWHLRF